MSRFESIKVVPELTERGGTLVIIGEVFEKGYINGLIEQALKQDMSIIYTTMGRRDGDGELRALTDEEIEEKGQSPIINLPLEAGFDYEKMACGQRIVDLLKGVRMSSWQEVKIDPIKIEEARELGMKRFKATLEAVFLAVEKVIPAGSRVVVAHTMAGGFPRAKIVMPIANRVFKGIGDRYASSKEFWDSGLGRLCDVAFQEVTAESYGYLLASSAAWRDRLLASGGSCSYVAYGYHGNEVLIGENYQWQSYAPYLQGFAKKRLEDISISAKNEGLASAVFNCPEILTNSTSIFLGVEVALYPLISALKREGEANPKLESLFKDCSALLSEEYSLGTIIEKTQDYLKSDVVNRLSDFSADWPLHNNREQMELMRGISTELIAMHKDKTHLITAVLSSVVVAACGRLMLALTNASGPPVCWLGHEVVAKAFLQSK